MKELSTRLIAKWKAEAKKLKTFRITEANQTKLTREADRLDRSEGWIINKCMEWNLNKWSEEGLRAVRSIASKPKGKV